MNIMSPCRKIIAGLCALALGGCGGMSLLEPQRIEYKSAGKLPPLEIPPDLTSPSRDDRFAVPDISTSGSATLSTYNAERAGTSRPASGAEVLPTIGKVRVERSGNQRWLVVPETPEKIWPTIKEFWQDLGFLVKVELPEAGVMETDWAENRAKIPQDFIRNALGRFIDQIYSTAERDKFRTRLERAADGSTEIYISHRGVVENYTSTIKDQTVWSPRPADPELEAEFLRRLMVRFGVEEERAKAQVNNSAATAERAKLVSPRDGAGMVLLDEPFDRAWRRVGLALDRVGFTVEDRDRSKGFYFVRYVDPQEDALDTTKKDTGILSRLIFWKPSKADVKAEQYRVLVRDERDTSQIQVLNKDGGQDTSDTARKILTLLHAQLK
jgi:outer membrane protein assembly factor BamC